MRRSLTLLAFALLVTFLLSAMIGRYPAPGLLLPDRIARDELAQRLLFNLRLPRLLTALLLGMTLAAAGMVFQLLFSNPLVEPGFLGVSQGAAFGAAFDGDADRCILVSASGRILDGDHILLIGAKAMRPRAVVATVMSNLGLERALATHGIGLLRTAVGDRYVLEEMLRQDLPLGGEQSGHVIFRQYATTGDGLLTALRAAAIAREAGASFDELTREFTVYPQRLVNVRFREKKPLDQLASVQREIRETEQEFGPAGRVLVRFSGTEPLARVMVEGPDAARVEFRARRIAAAIEAELGSAAS